MATTLFLLLSLLPPSVTSLATEWVLLNDSFRVAMTTSLTPTTTPFSFSSSSSFSLRSSLSSSLPSSSSSFSNFTSSPSSNHHFHFFHQKRQLPVAPFEEYYFAQPENTQKQQQANQQHQQKQQKTQKTAEQSKRLHQSEDLSQLTQPFPTYPPQHLFYFYKQNMLQQQLQQQQIPKQQQLQQKQKPQKQLHQKQKETFQNTKIQQQKYKPSHEQQQNYENFFAQNQQNIQTNKNKQQLVYQQTNKNNQQQQNQQQQKNQQQQQINTHQSLLQNSIPLTRGQTYFIPEAEQYEQKVYDYFDYYHPQQNNQPPLYYQPNNQLGYNAYNLQYRKYLQQQQQQQHQQQQQRQKPNRPFIPNYWLETNNWYGIPSINEDEQEILQLPYTPPLKYTKFLPQDTPPHHYTLPSQHSPQLQNTLSLQHLPQKNLEGQKLKQNYFMNSQQQNILLNSQHQQQYDNKMLHRTSTYRFFPPKNPYLNTNFYQQFPQQYKQMKYNQRQQSQYNQYNRQKLKNMNQQYKQQQQLWENNQQNTSYNITKYFSQQPQQQSYNNNYYLQPSTTALKAISNPVFQHFQQQQLINRQHQIQQKPADTNIQALPRVLQPLLLQKQILSKYGNLKHKIKTDDDDWRGGRKRDMKGATLIITTIIVEPYVMLKTNSTGNKKDSKKDYYGYLLDLLHVMSEQLNFRFEIKVVKDGNYGHVVENGKWDGMIGELVEGKAHMALAPLLVTDNRKPVVDFSLPFLLCQTSILISKKSYSSRLRGVSDFISQSQIKLGTLKKGVIPRSFRKSNNSMYKLLWKQMQKSDVLTSSNEEGISKCRSQDYAFLLPDTIGEYVANRQPCDLINIGPIPLMKKGLGLGFPKNSIYLPAFNKIMRNLSKSGYLDRLKEKWWKSQCGLISSDSRLKGRSRKYQLRSSRMLNLGNQFLDICFEFILSTLFSCLLILL